MKASAFLAISAFLWCISATILTSPTLSPDIWHDLRHDWYEGIRVVDIYMHVENELLFVPHVAREL